ncbi:MAG: hypothetical protein HDQ99_12125 [Lachnospiraceae bacterium]|nr:hypothetical protein [Lachnospiraceae bacterium]
MILKKIFRKIERIWTRGMLKACWLICSHTKNWKGITDAKYAEKIVVSLTSFPERIETVSETIKTLLMQTQKPNRIILWLGEEKFQHKEKDLPQILLKMQKYGLEIKWCHDIRSFTKLIPTLELCPDAIVITADDDLCYRRHWLKFLYKEYLKHPNMVCAHRVTKFYLENGSYEAVGGGYDTWPEATYLHKLTGVGGVLYPPHILNERVFEIDVFMQLCPTNDDIWFWLMAVLNNVKICVLKRPDLNLIYVKGTQAGTKLTSINDRGEKLFWKAFYNILNQYPILDKMLREEYQRLTQGN